MKVGILGTGNISDAFMEACKGLDIKVNAVQQRTIEKAKAFANKYDIKDYFDNYEDFFNSDIDTVYVALPNQLHYEVSLLSLKAHKNVLLEKPVVKTVAEYQTLLNEANKNKVKIFEVNRVYYQSSFQKLLEYKDKVKYIDLGYFQRSRRYDDYLNGQLPHIFDSKGDGGVLMDLGIYDLTFIVGLLGKPKFTSYACTIGRGGVDMEGSLLLQYDGVIARAGIAKTFKGNVHTDLYGDEVTIRSNDTVGFLNNLEINGDKYSFDENCFNKFLAKAVDIIDNNDLEAYNTLNNLTLDVLEVLMEARNSLD